MSDVEAVQRCERTYHRLREELAKVIVEQDQTIEQAMLAILARGHALLEGVPGLAKTLLISSLARAMALSFKRLQFTPDLLPSDVTGTDIIQENLETGVREYRFLPGPLFANLILADEIDRAPPKTQSAMLEAMPFFVLATQNPLEHEGTYPLPEAQLDRFLLYIRMDYPSQAAEWEIARRVTSQELGEVEPVLAAQEILELQQLAARVPVSEQVLGYALALVRASRPGTAEAPEFVNQWVSWGSGPRGVLALISCAQARAILHGRYHAGPGDIQAVARAALGHRIAVNYTAQAAGVGSEQIVGRLLEAIPADRKYEKASK